MLKIRSNKILIILCYFNRPKMVKNALESIILTNYQNWVLGFCDDGSDLSVEPIVREILKDHLDKVVFFSNFLPKKHGMQGFLMNRAIRETEADIGIMLCDDDALHPDYLFKINNFFTNNSYHSCYSNVILYNPLVESFKDVLGRKPEGILNSYKKPIKCSCKVDSSQVAWRINCNKKGNIWFDYPRERDHDSSFFIKLNNKYGLTQYSGFIGQFKGIHQKQLISNKYQWSQSNNIDL